MRRGRWAAGPTWGLDSRHVFERLGRRLLSGVPAPLKENWHTSMTATQMSGTWPLTQGLAGQNQAQWKHIFHLESDGRSPGQPVYLLRPGAYRVPCFFKFQGNVSFSDTCAEGLLCSLGAAAWRAWDYRIPAGMSKAPSAAFTSALSWEEHRWEGSATITDLLQEDHRVFSSSRVVVDLQQPPPVPMNCTPVIPSQKDLPQKYGARQ